MAQKRERLKQVRESAGFTQEGLAYRLGVDKSTVWRWEAGESRPEAWQQPRLAKALGITRAHLVELIAEAVPHPDRALAIQTLEWAAGQRRPGSALVAELSSHVGSIADRYEAQPSTSLLVAASQSHALIAGLLNHASGDRLRRKFHRVATESAMLLSQLVWDASARRNSAGAMAYCDEALSHAAEIGDQVAAAKAELRKAYVSLYGSTDSRDPAAGLALARHAANQGKPRVRRLPA